MICDKVGKPHGATYSLDFLWVSKLVVVGDRKDKCIGRCGLGCGLWGTTYTQQCLDHDLCHRDTGDNLGVCSGYFMKAVQGFLFGPNCF